METHQQDTVPLKSELKEQQEVQKSDNFDPASENPKNELIPNKDANSIDFNNKVKINSPNILNLPENIVAQQSPSSLSSMIDGSPTSDPTILQAKEALKQFNQEVITLLTTNESSKNQLTFYDMSIQIEALRDKLSTQFGEEFTKRSLTPSSIFDSIKKLSERAYKLTFRMFAGSIEIHQKGNYSKREIVNAVQQLLASNKISTKLPKQLEDKIKNSILNDVQILVFILTQIPCIFVQYLCDGLFEQLEDMEILEDTVNLQLCSHQIQSRVELQLSEMLPPGQSNYMLPMIKNHITVLLKLFSSGIAKIFNEAKQMMAEYITQFKSATEKPSNLTNRFVIIGLLKQLSKKCKNHILSLMEDSFFNLIDPDVQEKFALFSIQSNELFELYYDPDIRQIDEELDLDNQELEARLSLAADQFTSKSLSEEIEEKLQKVLKENEKFQLINLVRKDGHHGYLLELQNGKSYLMHKSRQGYLVLVNSKYISNGWRKINENDEAQTVKSLGSSSLKSGISSVGDFIQEDGKNLPPPDMNKTSVVYMNSAASDLGSSLGYCLANINKYKSTGAFLKDFGYIATVNGSITYIVQKLPIVGTLLLIGGLGFSTLKLSQNKVANTSSKMGQIGKLAIGTGSAFTGSVSGALLGQIVIPIPVLGAFIGGVVGGILGGKSSNYLIKMMNKSKFELMIKKIEKTLQPHGYWVYSREMLSIFGITNKFFLKSLPQLLEGVTMDRHDIWMTVNAYAMLTSYYSQKEHKEREKLQKQLDSCNDPEESKAIAAEMEFSNDWNPAIATSQQWLIDNNIPFVDFFQEIDQFLQQVVSQA